MPATVYRVSNDRAIEREQEFSDAKAAQFYAKVLNDRYPDAHARVIPVQESVNGHRAHLRHLRTERNRLWRAYQASGLEMDRKSYEAAYRRVANAELAEGR